MPRPLPRFRALAVSAALVGLCLTASCAHMPRWMGGSLDVEMRLDGEMQHEAKVTAGHILIFDLRDPKTSGYQFSGAFFETSLFRLDGIVPTEGVARVRYTFTALTPGEGDILIKIKLQKPDFQPEIYKRIHVTVTK